MIPPEAFKSKRAHVVILNDVAWSIVEARRGKDPIWMFPYRGKAVATMNNTAWQRARKEVGLPQVRVHDLRHYAERRIMPSRLPLPRTFPSARISSPLD